MNTKINEERTAFIRDLLKVLTSLYSWSGAVINGTTDDGYDMIELADGSRIRTSIEHDYWFCEFYYVHENGSGDWGWIHKPCRHDDSCVVNVATWVMNRYAQEHIRRFLSGPE